jgi:hypothetical protein
VKAEVVQALRLLRGADPAAAAEDALSAAGVSVDEAWQAFRAEADEARQPLGVGHRRRRVQMVLAAAAVVVIAAVALAITSASRDRIRAAGTTASSPAATPSSEAPTTASELPSSTPGPDPHLTATRELVDQMLAAAPGLPAAISVTDAPTAALDAPASISADENWIDRAAFWTAPGGLEEAISYLKAHPPEGMNLSSEGRMGDERTNTVDELSVSVDLPDTESSFFIELQFSVVPFGNGVAVRADAAAIWIPTKRDSEYIGAVDSVDVTVFRMANAPTVNRTLGNPAAQKLADAIDALPVATRHPGSCPNNRGYHDELTFHVGPRTIEVVNKVGGCGGVTITVGHASQPALAGNIDREITAALGLPATYGD